MNWKPLCILTLAGLGSTQAAVVINEVDLANDRVELINTGGTSVNMTSWWWCNRVNGSPSYAQFVPSSTIDAGLSSAGVTIDDFGSGETMVLQITSSFLPDALGELGLYNTNSFGSSTAIVDYVAWNSNGIRDIPANGAGLWPIDESIDTAGIGAGETLQALPGTTGIGPGEWAIGAGTLGATNIPEPGAVALLAVGGLGSLWRRRR